MPKSLFLMWLVWALPVQAATLTYSQESDREPWGAYLKELLQAVLASEQLDHQLVPNDIFLSQQRALTELREGRTLDIYWTMTSAEREQDLLVVRIPLLKGMLGQRLLIVRGEDRRFDQLEQFDQLQQFRYGQGHDWPDADILESGGLPVVRSSNYAGLMEMLSRFRFDAFPLGMNEVWQEIDKRPHLDVKVAPQVLLSYSAPVFLFLNPANHRLKKQLERGLLTLINDGRMDQIFAKHYGQLQQRAGLQQRISFHFNNPNMSPQTRQAMRAFRGMLLQPH